MSPETPLSSSETGLNNPLKNIDKAVVIVHPDNRTTGFRSTTEGPMYSFLGEKFLNIQTKPLGRYRRRGYTNLALIYGDTLPDHLSPIYPHGLIDAHIATPTFNSQVSDEIFAAELQEVLPQINFSADADIVIGGYRAGICVDAVKKALEDLGHTPQINYLLTNQAVFMLMAHQSRQMLGRLYDEEHFAQDRAVWDSIKKGKTIINT